MEKSSILQMLTQLESDLNDIKSAKEQIDAVIEADSKITGNLALYAKQLADIATQMGMLKTEVKGNLKDMTSTFDSEIKTKLQKTSDAIKIVEELSADVQDKIEKAYTDVNAELTESCSQISSSFEDSITSLSSSFEKRTTNVGNLFNNETTKTLAQLKECVKVLKESSPDVTSAKVEILTKTQEVNQLVYQLKVSVNTILTSSKAVSKDIATILNSLNTLGVTMSTVDQNTQTILGQLQETDKKYKHLNSVCGNIKSGTTRNQQLLYVVIFFVVIDVLLHFI